MMKDWLKLFFWPVAAVILGVGWGMTVLLGGARSICGPNCTAFCQALDITYEVEGLPLQMDNGRNAFRKSIYTQEVVLTEINRVPVRGTLGDTNHAVAVLLEQNHGGAGTYYYIAAALPNKHGAVHGTNALPLGDWVQVQEIKLQDGIIWITVLTHEPGADLAEPPTVTSTQQVCVQDGRLYFPNAQPTH